MNIYESVPEENIEHVPNEDRHKILEHLKSRPGTPIPARQIAAYCGYPTKGTQVETRKAITELIEIDKQPIVSISKGFMYATHPNQIRHYISSLQERKLGLQRRINALEKIYQECAEECDKAERFI